MHLLLSDEPYLLDQGVDDTEPLLEEITADGWVQLRWVADLGLYRKIVPFLQAGGYGQAERQGERPGEENGLFNTVDDDTRYLPRFIKYLVRNHARHGCVLAPVGMASGSPFLAYADWHNGVREPQLPTGKSGVLFRRSWFPQDLELEAALAVAPTHDDLRLSWFTARQGVPA